MTLQGKLTGCSPTVQSKRWGSVEWYHDVDRYELQSRLAASTLFVHWCSENTTIRQKASLVAQWSVGGAPGHGHFGVGVMVWLVADWLKDFFFHPLALMLTPGERVWEGGRVGFVWILECMNVSLFSPEVCSMWKVRVHSWQQRNHVLCVQFYPNVWFAVSHTAILLYKDLKNNSTVFLPLLCVNMCMW